MEYGELTLLLLGVAKKMEYGELTLLLLATENKTLSTENAFCWEYSLMYLDG